MGAVLKMTERNGRDILDWLEEMATRFDAQIGYIDTGDNPYHEAACEIRALRLAVNK